MVDGGFGFLGPRQWCWLQKLGGGAEGARVVLLSDNFHSTATCDQL